MASYPMRSWPPIPGSAGGRQPFTFDAKAIAKAVSNKKSPITAAEILSHRADIKKLFTELPDGRWAASPEIFSVTDPNSEVTED